MNRLGISAGGGLAFLFTWYASSLALVLEARGFSAVKMGPIIGATLLSSVIGSLVAGLVIDRLGTKTFGLAVLPLFLGVNLGYLLATSFEWLVVVRFGHGLTSDALMVVIMTYLRTSAPTDGDQKRVMSWFSAINYGASAVAARVATELVAISLPQWSLVGALCGVVILVVLFIFLFGHQTTRQVKKQDNVKREDWGSKPHFIITAAVIAGIAFSHTALFTFLPLDQGAKIGGLTISLGYVASGFCGLLLVKKTNKLSDMQTSCWCLAVMMVSIALVFIDQPIVTPLAGILFGGAYSLGMLCLRQIVYNASGKRAIGVAIPNMMNGPGNFVAAIALPMIGSHMGYHAMWYFVLPVLGVCSASLTYLLYCEMKEKRGKD